MEIINTGGKRQTLFQDLEPGDVFETESSGETFILIKAMQDEGLPSLRAFNPLKGDAWMIPYDKLVTRVEAKMVVIY